MNQYRPRHRELQERYDTRRLADRWWCLPLDTRDVGVPLGGIGRIIGVRTW